MTNNTTLIFKVISDMFPFTDLGRLYGLIICGKPLLEHVIESVYASNPNSNITINFEAQNNRFLNLLTQLKRKLPFQVSTVTKSEPPSALTNEILADEVIAFHEIWHLLSVMKKIVDAHTPILSRNIEIEEDTYINGRIDIGEGSRICRGTIIEGDVYIGKNCLIGFNNILRGPCVIEDNSKLGLGVEVKNALIQRNTVVGPFSYIGDSIIDSFCSFGALTRTSNFRLDQNDISVLCGSELVSTGRTKLGCFVGSNVRTGVGVVILPGRRIGHNVFIEPNIIVRKNLESNRHYFVEQNVGVRMLEEIQ